MFNYLSLSEYIYLMLSYQQKRKITRILLKECDYTSTVHICFEPIAGNYAQDVNFICSLQFNVSHLDHQYNVYDTMNQYLFGNIYP